MLIRSINQKTGYILALFALAISSPVFAQTAEAPAAPVTDGYTVLRYVLIGVAVIFAIIIAILGAGLRSASEIYLQKRRKEKLAAKTGAIISALLLATVQSFAQTTDATAAVAIPEPKFSLPTDVWVYLAAILLMFAVIMWQVRTLYSLLEVKSQREAARIRKGVKLKTFFQRINNTVAVEEEDTLDMNHNYDGIRELDNKVPGWWSLAFYATILFGVVYLYRMFISSTLPTQEQELQREHELAAIQKIEYLKTSANNIDENTAVMSDAAGIADAAGLFAANCVACHGDKGQGGIGPNLTDNYWIHKGSLKDVFTVIKYGVPEKGMIAWKDNFSPKQIQDLASFIENLKGTNPPGGKEPQGDLYTEEGAAAPAAADSTVAPAVADSTKK